MNAERTVLVMAGAREAHALVIALLARGRRVVVSLPEPERMFDPFPVPARIGAFEDCAEMIRWMEDSGVEQVIDASHSFDDHVRAVTYAAAKGLSLPYLRLLRPPWKATAKDHWSDMPSIAEAVRSLPSDARVFTNTGWASLPEFADFHAEKLFVRQTSDVQRNAPFPFVDVIEGQPPFSQFQEEALFRRLAVSHLICRNVGGAASMSKLLAARAMQMPVLMIGRAPQASSLPHVETVAKALAWDAGL